jgi:hypothetical protein
LGDDLSDDDNLYTSRVMAVDLERFRPVTLEGKIGLRASLALLMMPR